MMHAVPTPPAGEKIEVTETIETRVTKPGLFGRIARALQASPITTSVGVSLGTSAAVVGAYNYRRTGSVMPAMVSASDVADVAQAVAGFLGR